MSETDLARETLAPYAVGRGIDVGFGGSALIKGCLTFDMPTPYTQTGLDEQVFQGDAKEFPFIRDGVLDWLHASHLLEDWHYDDLKTIITEWRRVLRVGGLLIINCPDQRVFKRHITLTNQGDNLCHKEQDFSLSTFKEWVMNHTGPWEIVMETPLTNSYSWFLVAKKV